MSDRLEKRRRADAAHDLQIQAALIGGIKYTALGAFLVTFGHCTWPAFRRQTLPFKIFLVSAFTMFGVVVDADRALFRHELEERTRESTIRRLAIVDLGRRGVVATEAEIVKWKAEHFKQADAK